MTNLRVASSKARVSQGTLFSAERPLETAGAARSRTGDFFEELAKFALVADRIKVDSTADICPDLRIGSSNVFVESKAIGNSGQAILYANRVAKDRRFIREGNRIVYAFWRHRFAAMGAKTIEELWRGLGASIECLSLLDERTLRGILQGRPKRRINSRYMKSGVRNGYGSNGYGVGWCFPYSSILAACSPTLFEASGEPYGIEVAGVPIFATRRAMGELSI